MLSHYHADADLTKLIKYKKSHFTIFFCDSGIVYARLESLERFCKFLWAQLVNNNAEYLESVVMSTDKLLITGDFNFHMDVPTDPNNLHFRDLLDAMGLVQHVKQPTHIHGHTLDLIITRQSDDFRCWRADFWEIYLWSCCRDM